MMHELRLGRFLIKGYEVRFALLIGAALLALWLLAAHLYRPDHVFLLQIPPIVREPTKEQMSRLPNNDTYLLISLRLDGSLLLNNYPFEGAGKYQNLAAKLRRVFEQRVEASVLDESVAEREDLPLEKRVVRRAVIIAPPDAKYGDVVRLIDAVKSGGFDDLWLQIDGDSFWWTFDMLRDPHGPQ